jgi:hypothetical protein
MGTYRSHVNHFRRSKNWHMCTTVSWYLVEHESGEKLETIPNCCTVSTSHVKLQMWFWDLWDTLAYLQDNSTAYSTDSLITCDFVCFGQGEGEHCITKFENSGNNWVGLNRFVHDIFDGCQRKCHFKCLYTLIFLNQHTTRLGFALHLKFVPFS